LEAEPIVGFDKEAWLLAIEGRAAVVAMAKEDELV
jgi:hypothetical protein